MNDRGEDGFGALLPDIRVQPPADASRAMAERLRAVESRNITYVDDGWPIFWREARGDSLLAGSTVADEMRRDFNVRPDLCEGRHSARRQRDT